ncbi:hypothetical protein OBBRIDRAFT_732026 [Obba rivulosa]|uniref:Uncharacterized protein n=1 Tax=Obba rivulosa TaxID=1052685 RepID=A0A8E2DNG4_9APHY|nr:hypothetical protein OBBRIDRAFT_732026 [Obba rivulosa]
MEIVLEDTNVITAKHLRNGSVLFEMSSSKAASWLRGHNTIKSFASALRGETTVKAQGYAVLAEFVYISFDTTFPHSWSEVEMRSNLDIDNIKDGHWIKPVNRRQQGQHFAYPDCQPDYTEGCKHGDL